MQPRFVEPKHRREADVITETTDVLLIGFGRFGNIVGRFLKANGIPTTILDFDAEQIETLGETRAQGLLRRRQPPGNPSHRRGRDERS